MAVKAYQVVVVGCPRSELTGTIKERKGVGKSCFCNRFVSSYTFSLQVRHDSVLSETEWRHNSIYNKDHFLYWGAVTKNLPDGDTARFHIVEQTELYNADDNNLFFTDDDYITRACSTRLSSKHKIAYIDNASQATQLFPNEMFKGEKGVTGFICLFDPTLQGEDSKRQVEFLSKLLKELVKTKRKVILACTKCDEASSDQIEQGANLADTVISKAPLYFVQTSALLDHNIEEAFFKIVKPYKTRTKNPPTAIVGMRSRDDSVIFSSSSIADWQKRRLSSLIGRSHNTDVPVQDGDIRNATTEKKGSTERVVVFSKMPDDSSMNDEQQIRNIQGVLTEEQINEHPDIIG